MTDGPNKLGADHAAIDLSSAKNADTSLQTLLNDKERADFYHNAMLRSTQAFGSGYPDGRLLVVNPAFEKLTGYTADELRSISWATDLTPAKWHEAEARVLAKLVETGEPQAFEKEYIRKDGSIVPIELLVHLVRDDDGKPAYYFSFITDITERKRSEQARLQAEQNSRLILDSISDGFFAIDREWRFTYVNRAAGEILGVAPAELVGRIIWEIYPGLHGSTFETVYRSVMETGETGTELAYYPDHDRWYHVTVNPYEQGISIFFRNVTEEKRSEQKLRAWHDTFRYFVEYSPFGVFVVDADFRLRHVSAGAQKVFENVRPLDGRDFAEALRIVWPEPFATEAIGHFHHTLETGETYHSPSTVQARNDIEEIQSYDWKVERFVMPDGRYAVVCHFYDLSERQQYEAELQAKSEQIASLLKSAPVGMAFVDRQHHYVQVNDRLAEINGVDAAAHIGRTIEEVLPERTQSMTPTIDRVFETGEAVANLEVSGETDREPGKTKHWLTGYYPVRDAQGRVTMVGAWVADISDRKLVEDQLLENRERLQAALDGSGAGTFRWNIKTDELDWDENLDRLFGLPPGVSARSLDSFVEMVHPDDRAAVIERCERCASEGADFEMEFRVVWPNGEVRWLVDKGKTYRDENWNPSYMTGMCVDITHRKHAEEELRHSMSLISAISDSTEDVIYAKDLEGRLTFANPATLSLIGKQLDEVIGRTDLELLQDKAAAAEVMANDRRIMESGEVEDVEEMVPMPDGTERFWYSHKMPYRDADGRVIGLLGVSRDISEIKRAQAERQNILEREQHARRESDAANRAKDEFLAVLSHELRTPLHAIKGWLTLLGYDNLDAERRARAFEVISRNVEAQNALIEDILEVSRIISGKLHLDKTRESLVSIVLDAIEEIKPLANSKFIRIETTIDPRTDEIVADRLRLRQVVINLLSNAIKFTPEGGSVDINLESKGDTARLIVADDGVGIEGDLLPYIFERFKQADSSSRRGHGGLGLGLAIVKHIVDLHGGRITAHSEGLNRGAVFTLELPLVSAPAAPLENGRNAPGVESRALDSDHLLDGYRILLVEDDADSLEMLRIALGHRGAQVTPVPSSAAALDQLSGNTFDLIISDLGLPGMDGFDLIGRVRNDLNLSGEVLPAIALSGYASSDDQVRSISAGFQSHLPKPLDLATLAESIVALKANRHN